MDRIDLFLVHNDDINIAKKYESNFNDYFIRILFTKLNDCIICINKQKDLPEHVRILPILIKFKSFVCLYF